MSLIGDAVSVVVGGDTTIPLSTNIDSVEITVDLSTPDVTLTVPNSTQTVEVQVPGVQGAPGLQNVYIQTADPSKDSNGDTIWGAEQTNYIWITV